MNSSLFCCVTLVFILLTLDSSASEDEVPNESETQENSRDKRHILDFFARHENDPDSLVDRFFGHRRHHDLPPEFYYNEGTNYNEYGNNYDTLIPLSQYRNLQYEPVIYNQPERQIVNIPSNERFLNSQRQNIHFTPFVEKYRRFDEGIDRVDDPNGIYIFNSLPHYYRNNIFDEQKLKEREQKDRTPQAEFNVNSLPPNNGITNFKNGVLPVNFIQSSFQGGNDKNTTASNSSEQEFLATTFTFKSLPHFDIKQNYSVGTNDNKIVNNDGISNSAGDQDVEDADKSSDSNEEHVIKTYGFKSLPHFDVKQIFASGIAQNPDATSSNSIQNGGGENQSNGFVLQEIVPTDDNLQVSPIFEIHQNYSNVRKNDQNGKDSTSNDTKEGIVKEEAFESSIIEGSTDKTLDVLPLSDYDSILEEQQVDGEDNSGEETRNFPTFIRPGGIFHNERGSNAFPTTNQVPTFQSGISPEFGEKILYNMTYPHQVAVKVYYATPKPPLQAEPPRVQWQKSLGNIFEDANYQSSAAKSVEVPTKPPKISVKELLVNHHRRHHVIPDFSSNQPLASNIPLQNHNVREGYNSQPEITQTQNPTYTNNRFQDIQSGRNQNQNARINSWLHHHFQRIDSDHQFRNEFTNIATPISTTYRTPTTQKYRFGSTNSYELRFDINEDQNNQNDSTDNNEHVEQRIGINLDDRFGDRILPSKNGLEKNIDSITTTTKYMPSTTIERITRPSTIDDAPKRQKIVQNDKKEGFTKSQNDKRIPKEQEEILYRALQQFNYYKDAHRHDIMEIKDVGNENTRNVDSITIQKKNHKEGFEINKDIINPQGNLQLLHEKGINTHSREVIKDPNAIKPTKTRTRRPLRIKVTQKIPTDNIETTTQKRPDFNNIRNKINPNRPNAQKMIEDETIKHIHSTPRSKIKRPIRIKISPTTSAEGIGLISQMVLIDNDDVAPVISTPKITTKRPTRIKVTPKTPAEIVSDIQKRPGSSGININKSKPKIENIIKEFVGIQGSTTKKPFRGKIKFINSNNVGHNSNSGNIMKPQDVVDQTPISLTDKDISEGNIEKDSTVSSDKNAVKIFAGMRPTTERPYTSGEFETTKRIVFRKGHLFTSSIRENTDEFDEKKVLNESITTISSIEPLSNNLNTRDFDDDVTKSTPSRYGNRHGSRNIPTTDSSNILASDSLEKDLDKFRITSAPSKKIETISYYEMNHNAQQYGFISWNDVRKSYFLTRHDLVDESEDSDNENTQSNNVDSYNGGFIESPISISNNEYAQTNDGDLNNSVFTEPPFSVENNEYAQTNDGNSYNNAFTEPPFSINSENALIHDGNTDEIGTESISAGVEDRPSSEDFIVFEDDLVTEPAKTKRRFHIGNKYDSSEFDFERTPKRIDDFTIKESPKNIIPTESEGKDPESSEDVSSTTSTGHRFISRYDISDSNIEELDDTNLYLEPDEVPVENVFAKKNSNPAIEKTKTTTVRTEELTATVNPKNWNVPKIPHQFLKKDKGVLYEGGVFKIIKLNSHKGRQPPKFEATNFLEIPLFFNLRNGQVEENDLAEAAEANKLSNGNLKTSPDKIDIDGVSIIVGNSVREVTERNSKSLNNDRDAKNHAEKSVQNSQDRSFRIEQTRANDRNHNEQSNNESATQVPPTPSRKRYQNIPKTVQNDRIIPNRRRVYTGNRYQNRPHEIQDTKNRIASRRNEGSINRVLSTTSPPNRKSITTRRNRYRGSGTNEKSIMRVLTTTQEPSTKSLSTRRNRYRGNRYQSNRIRKTTTSTTTTATTTTTTTSTERPNTHKIVEEPIVTEISSHRPSNHRRYRTKSQSRLHSSHESSSEKAASILPIEELRQKEVDIKIFEIGPGESNPHDILDTPKIINSNPIQNDELIGEEEVDGIQFPPETTTLQEVLGIYDPILDNYHKEQLANAINNPKRTETSDMIISQEEQIETQRAQKLITDDSHTHLEETTDDSMYSMVNDQGITNESAAGIEKIEEYQHSKDTTHERNLELFNEKLHSFLERHYEGTKQKNSAQGNTEMEGNIDLEALGPNQSLDNGENGNVKRARIKRPRVDQNQEKSSQNEQRKGSAKRIMIKSPHGIILYNPSRMEYNTPNSIIERIDTINKYDDEGKRKNGEMKTENNITNMNDVNSDGSIPKRIIERTKESDLSVTSDDNANEEAHNEDIDESQSDFGDEYETTLKSGRKRLDNPNIPKDLAGINHDAIQKEIDERYEETPTEHMNKYAQEDNTNEFTSRRNSRRKLQSLPRPQRPVHIRGGKERKVVHTDEDIKEGERVEYNTLKRTTASKRPVSHLVIEENLNEGSQVDTPEEESINMNTTPRYFRRRIKVPVSSKNKNSDDISVVNRRGNDRRNRERTRRIRIKINSPSSTENTNGEEIQTEKYQETENTLESTTLSTRRRIKRPNPSVYNSRYSRFRTRPSKSQQTENNESTKDEEIGKNEGKDEKEYVTEEDIIESITEAVRRTTLRNSRRQNVRIHSRRNRFRNHTAKPSPEQKTDNENEKLIEHETNKPEILDNTEDDTINTEVGVNKRRNERRNLRRYNSRYNRFGTRTPKPIQKIDNDDKIEEQSTNLPERKSVGANILNRSEEEVTPEMIVEVVTAHNNVNRRRNGKYNSRYSRLRTHTPKPEQEQKSDDEIEERVKQVEAQTIDPEVEATQEITTEVVIAPNNGNKRRRGRPNQSIYKSRYNRFRSGRTRSPQQKSTENKSVIEDDKESQYIQRPIQTTTERITTEKTTLSIYERFRRIRPRPTAVSTTTTSEPTYDEDAKELEQEQEEQGERESVISTNGRRYNFRSRRPFQRTQYTRATKRRNEDQ